MIQFCMRVFVVLSLSSLLLAPAARAQDDLAEAFGSVGGVLDISMSPDGNNIAFVAPGAGLKTDLFTIDLATGLPKKILTASGDPERLMGCGWVSNKRLVCKIGGYQEYNKEIYGFTNIFALNMDGSEPKLLSKRPNDASIAISLGGGSVVDWLPEEENFILMTRYYGESGGVTGRERVGWGVDRVDTLTGKTKIEEPAKVEASEYITDGEGNVRILGMRIKEGRTELDSGRIKYFFRRKGSDNWEDLSTLNYAERAGFNPYAVDPAKNVVYGFKPHKGRRALMAMSMDGSGRVEIIYSNDTVDVDGLIRIGRKDRVVGVSYATDKRNGIYFDPELKKLSAALGSALGGDKSVQFVDSSLDESKLLLFASSDVDPGQYYIFDKATKSMRPLLSARPLLANVKLAPVKPVSYPAADGTMIPGYLTLPVGSDGKNLPAIVMPHGGPDSRDEWGFDWWAQFYASKGFAVLQPNYRGSDGYGDSWYQKNGFQSWQTAIGDVADAGKWMISEGIAKPEALSIVGWSYGGYAALQSAVVNPALFKSVVAIAPVTDLQLLKSDSNDYYNEKVVKDFIGSGPHIREGSPAQNADKITVPVMLVHGDFDRNVDVGHSRLMERKLKDAGKTVQYIEYPKLEHSLFKPEARIEMLQRSLAFLPK
ncbi:S9 family peptidase [Parasphingorhabdus sp.]|uniref:S9 family peptidase n=1 Tax=Parasphingorhabdus sp. TaxID=2709688 RepID=UPI003001F9AD